MRLFAGTFSLMFNSHSAFQLSARKLRRAALFAFLLFAAVGLTACAGLVSSSGQSGQPLVNVLLSSNTLTIQASQSHSFSVTVQNDPQNLGVSWSLSGSGCSGASCGTLTNSTTTSVTYNAPAQAPNPPAVTLVASSLADPSRSAAATITVTAGPQPISVSVTPPSLSVQVSTSASFAATLQNDSQNQGVSWSLSGTGCSGAGCGTLTNATTTSVTYTAPSAVPSPALVTLTATSNADKTKFAASSITITSTPQPISVAVNPPSTSIQVSLSSIFSAVVQNDSQNKGVTWSLAGAGCSGLSCGTLTNATASSVTYNAPATLPSPASVTLTATSVADTTKSGSSTITVTAAPAISVTLNPPSASVQVSTTASFSATLQNDSQNKGVTWSLSGSGCSGATCGTLTNVTTTSVTYNAPTTVPNPATITLKATSIADSTKSASSTITLTAAPLPISVAVNPPSASVQVSATANFSATLQNDTQNKGVTWSLSGTGCSGSACGTLTNVTTSSVTYSAPAATPSPAAVTLKATSIADTTKSGSSTITVTAAPPPISVAINPSSTSVQVSATANFSATLQNDSQNKGVTWSLSGSGCSGASCGTLTNVTTTSVTYNAPATAPNPASVTLKATSIADTTKSGSSAITVTSVAPPISVAINPSSTSVQVSATANFSATLQNDSQNKGVTWSLSGTGCSGATCGTLTSVTTTTVTYNAPATPPSPASVILKATSIADTTKSGSATITLTVPPPTAPGNLTATANGSPQVGLSWSASTDVLGISAYLVERCQGTSCSSFTQIASTASTSFNDTGLAGSTSYSYRVRAEDPANNLGAYSSVASATTDASSGGGSTPTFVWSKSAANTTGLNINSYTSNLPTSGTLSGNVVIATFQYAVGSGASASVKDDKGDAFTLLASNSNGNQTVATYCAAPATGARVLTITFSGGSPAYVAMINASEWYNLTCALDGSATNSSSAASISAGSIATTTDGDLIYQAAEEDGNTGTERWTPGSSWSLLSASSGIAGANTPQAAQFQVQTTHGSINPSLSMSNADSWNSVAVALKASSAGTPPPAGIRILHLQEEAIPAGPSGPFTVQFPSSGNLLISATIDCPDLDVTGITDSNGNTHVSTGPALNNSLSGSVQTFYAGNAVTSNNLSLTFAMTGPPNGGSDFFLFDVTGAASAPFDTRATATGDIAASSGSGTGTVAGPTISPSTANGLVIAQMAVDTNTIINITPGFFAGSIPNPVGQTNPTNENNGWAFDFNAAAGTRQYTWTTSPPGVNFWASTAVAFKAQ